LRTSKVTIGITTYNAEETVRDAINSALSQTIPIEQIIIVDDCSTDSTFSILNEYECFPNIEVYQNPVNSRVAYSRNRIIEHAVGDFIVLFDDDDISAPQRAEAQVSRITQYEKEFANGAPVTCHTARLQYFPGQKQRVEPTMGTVIGKRAPAGAAVARRVLMGESLEDGYGSCATCSQAGRTETYRKLGGFDSSFSRIDDTDYVIRLALAGGHFVGLPETLVTQKMTATSEKNLFLLHNEWQQLLQKHEKLFASERDFRFCMMWSSLKFKWLGEKHRGFLIGLSRLLLKHPILTLHRIIMAFPTLRRNRAFRKFVREIK